MKKRFTQEQIVGFLREAQIGGMPAGIISICIYGPLNWLRSLDNGAPAEGRRVDF